MRDISTARLSARAVEYFGDDVQSFGIRRPELGRFEVWQRPHYLPFRVVASCWASDARHAAKTFNAMAAAADRRCR